MDSNNLLLKYENKTADPNLFQYNTVVFRSQCIILELKILAKLLQLYNVYT